MGIASPTRFSCRSRRVLVVSAYFPSFQQSGSATRLAQILRSMRSHGAIVHLVRIPLYDKKRPKSLDAFVDGWSTLNLVGEDLPETCTLGYRTATTPRGWGGRLAAAVRKRVAPAKVRLVKIASKFQADVIFIDHTSLAHLVGEIPEWQSKLTVVDTHDILHIRDDRFKRMGHSVEAGISRDDESRLLEPFDVVIAIQDQEQRLLQRMLPRSRVVTIGHGAEVAKQPCRSKSIRFVGSNYVVNVTGFISFLQEAWPEIRRKDLDVCLELAGTISNNPTIRKATKQDDRIVRYGEVPKVADLYHGPSVMICPLWVGSGLKIKLVEALAHGKATVASPIAAEGLEDGCNTAFIVANTPKDFADPILKILASSEERGRWENAAARYAADKFNPQTISGTLEQILLAPKNRYRSEQ